MIVRIMAEVDETQGPVEEAMEGESLTFPFQFSYAAILRMLLLTHREVGITVAVLSVVAPGHTTSHEQALARLIGTCQGLIECFEAGDKWTPAARSNAASELRKGIQGVIEA